MCRPVTRQYFVERQEMDISPLSTSAMLAHWPPSPSSLSSSSPRSHISLLSTSTSLSSSSTFSDVSSLASAPSPSVSPAPTPTFNKTNAFFGSPFSTRPPSPVPAPSLRVIKSPQRPSIVDVFATSPPPKPQSPFFLPPPILDSSIEATPRPKNSQPAFSVPEDLRPGSVVSSLHLVRTLGQGAFSSVWLAEDDSPVPLSRAGSRKRKGVSRNSSVRGTRPSWAIGSVYLEEGTKVREVVDGRLVAVKMTPRGDDRTRVSFVREVEVLRHISHPNITPLLSHFTTDTYHVLVLPYLPGGDLLGLVNSDVMHAALTESVLQRIWSELCRAVGWMHGVDLVHRDVKLENILLTSATLPSTPPSSPTPLIKLTDFGLSRFIDPAAPLLGTRCGSEAYAAPELVMSGRRYDARETDAWACGVVLYALCGRQLPFGEGVGPGEGACVRIGSEREGRAGGANGAERRHWLMRIARGEYEWPGDGGAEVVGTGELVGARLVASVGARRIVEKLLVRDPGKRARIAELWADGWMLGPMPTGRRSRESSDEDGIVESNSRGRGLSDDGVGSENGSEGWVERVVFDEPNPIPEVRDNIGIVPGLEDRNEDVDEDEDEDEDDWDGWLVDGDSINGIACQEVQ